MSSDPLRDALSAGIAAAPKPAPPRPAAPANGPTRATRNNNPGNIEDGPFARRQPGYQGGDGRFAIFDSPESGRSAQISLLNGYVAKGHNTPRKIASRWAPPHENDSLKYAQGIAGNLGIGIDDPIPAGGIPKIAAAQDAIEGYHGPKALEPEYKPDPNDPLRQVLANGSPQVLPTQDGQPDANGHQPSGGILDTVLGWLPGGAPDAEVSPEAGAVVDPQTGAPLAQGQVGRNRPQAGASSPLKTAALIQADAGSGFARGVMTPGRTASAGVGGIAKWAGMDPAEVDKAIQFSDKTGTNAIMQGLFGPVFGPMAGALANSPPGDSTAYKAGRFMGEMTSMLPLMEFKPLQAAAEAKNAGKLGQTLARYGDYSLQGAGAGAALSEGNDPLARGLEGGLFGPAFGFLGEKVLAPVAGFVGQHGGRALGWAEGKAAQLGNAIKSYIAPAEEAAAPAAKVMPQEVQDGITAMIDGRQSYAKIKEAYPEWVVNDNEASIRGWVAARRRGDKTPVSFTPRPNEVPNSTGMPSAEITGPDLIVTASPKDLAAAIGSKAAKQGIEATAELPPQVAEHYQALREKGVDAGEALREADIRAIGAQPLVANVKRTPEDMRALAEGAKQSTPEGSQLSQMIADNNAAVHAKAQGMVAEHGGVPAQGEGMQAAAEALAAKADRAKANVTKLYEEARAQDGDQRVSIDALRELLAKPRYRASPEWRGLRRQIAAMAKENNGRFTPGEIDELSKIVNDQYNPLGGGINNMVGEAKAALNESLDQFVKAGPAFKAARKAHADYASKYEDPEGVASLIRRDAKGNFLNEDNWRATENVIGSASDKKFVQMVNRLREDGSEGAISRLKATVLQRAYERASATAADRAGNATLSGKQWFAELNKIGTKKLNALFSRAEIADIAHTGRAAIHLNESIPGAVNTSNTASAIMDALGKSGKGFTGKKATIAKILLHGGGQAAETAFSGAPGVGNAVAAVVTNQLSKGADALANRSAAQKLAAALREQMSPEAARVAEAAARKRMADAILRANSSRRLGRQLSPGAGATENRRSEQ